ncbi:MAG: head-tail connector protein [Hyphomicrobiaceae bacterium]
MASILRSGPAVEPVSLAEAKVHLRIDTNAEDTLIQSLIMTSRLHIEAALDLALITQSWRLHLHRWPRARSLNLPLRPVQSLTAVKVFDDDGDSQTLDIATFILDGSANPARLILSGSGSLPLPGRPANGIEIDFVAGFGDAPSDVPHPIRQALLLLTAHWYENREPVEIGAAATVIPGTVSDLLAPYRQRRL